MPLDARSDAKSLRERLRFHAVEVKAPYAEDILRICVAEPQSKAKGQTDMGEIGLELLSLYEHGSYGKAEAPHVGRHLNDRRLEIVDPVG